MKKLILMQGLPGSGKTTYAREYIKNNPNTVRVSRDDIRTMLGEYWVPERENLVTGIERDTVASSLDSGYDVMVDATNMLGKIGWEMLADRHSATIEIVSFLDVPLITCIQRDQQRERSVGKLVIENMYNKYIDND